MLSVRLSFIHSMELFFLVTSFEYFDAFVDIFRVYSTCKALMATDGHGDIDANEEKRFSKSTGKLPCNGLTY